ncbi:MAG: hypothetical protein MOB07_29180 [Acidobacteria bacterium]|nr:hypothetical protein [Acidobacteriota bacterium]
MGEKDVPGITEYFPGTLAGIKINNYQYPANRISARLMQIYLQFAPAHIGLLLFEWNQ